MKSFVLQMYASKCEIEYLRFMGISELPNYRLESQIISLAEVNKQGYGAPAETFYDTQSGNHTLKLWENIPKLNAEYMVFHEFTHILDSETYGKKDKVAYVKIKGYMEYHAAQIDYMRLLGAKSIKDPFSFSMKQIVDTYSGSLTAEENLYRPYGLVKELIERPDFPNNVETLATAIGAAFNFYGYRSVCRMYATDYVEKVDNTPFVKLFGKEMETVLNAYMTGWFDDSKVKMIGEIYFFILTAMMKKYNF